MDSNRKSSVAGFEGKSFYFDLQNSPQIARQLRQHITTLGGVIKGFLDHRVKYIITNRPKDQWPPKLDTEETNSAVKRQSLPLTTTIEVVRDQSFQSPINLNKNSSFSRGKLLLSAIAKSQQTVAKPSLPTDVLERGRHWNITILKAQDVLDFCLRYLSPVSAADNQAVSSAQIKRLKGPYVKVEDNRLQHRPSYKELTEWPQINYEESADCPYLCPFIKKKKTSKDTTRDTGNESLEGLAIKNRGNNGVSNTTTTAIKSKPKSPNKTALPLNKSVIKKRRSPAFCEICGVDYDDLFEHLKTELHESFTKNEDNYKELKGVIESFKPFNQSLKFGGKPIQSDGRSSDSSDGSDGEDEDRPASSHFQSTPNMSTIQLNGSKHKSHFVSIHTLIGTKCTKQVIEEEDIDVEDNDNCDQSDERTSKTDLVLVPPSVDSPDKQTLKTINKLMNLDNCDEDYDLSRTEVVYKCSSELL